MIDATFELFSQLWRHRVRTLLTSFSMAWGIFMLVLLLGLGRGLENNVRWMFRDDATNSVWFYKGQTSVPFRGHAVGRRIVFNTRDYEAVSDVEGVEYNTGRFYPFRSALVRWRDEVDTLDVRTVHPEHRHIEQTIMLTGRWLSFADLKEKRKVAVIGKEVVKNLFSGQNPIGEWIDVRGVHFRVIGTYRDDGGKEEEGIVYLPLTTAQAAYGGGERLNQIMVTVGDANAEETERVATRITEVLARRHHFDATDSRAIRVRNNMEQAAQIMQIFTLIEAFIWTVGLGTVAAGMVGVSNILLVSVAERTQEFGLRKALGATPFNLVMSVLWEAFVLTGLSGYLGMVAGVFVLEAIRYGIPENEYVRDPEVHLPVAIAATVLLIIAGLIAGFVPAFRAARVNPIDALRSQ